MAWTFTKAVKRGVALMITVGDDAGEVDQPLTYSYTYPMRAGQTAAVQLAV